MNKILGTCMVVIAVASVAIAAVIGNAQPPLVPPAMPSELPTLQPHPDLGNAPDPQRTRESIQQALQGNVTRGNGDPVLDEMLQIIQRRGSVLDGSVLDGSVLDTKTLDANVPDTEDALVNQPPLASDEDDRALAAESLLRSARLFSKLAPLDPAQRELVARMRREAAKLLQP